MTLQIRWPSRVITGFLAVQALAWGYFLVGTDPPREPVRPVESNVIRPAAWRIPPAEGPRELVDPESLERILALMEPRWKIPKVNAALHAVRLWGPDARFSSDAHEQGTRILSSAELLRVLTDVPEAERVGFGPSPFLFRSDHGVRAPVAASLGGIAHVGQYLKAMGEIGSSAGQPLVLRDGTVLPLGAAVMDALANFDPTDEIEFIAVALSRWLPPTRSWFDKRGRGHDFDEVATRLLSKPLGKSACLGIHNLYALVNLVRANRTFSILSAGVASEVEERLLEASRRLECSQGDDGLWTADWPGASSSGSRDIRSLEAIVATGHHLEWIALSPRGMRPGPKHVRDAAVALSALLLRHSRSTASGSFPEFSHACRALILLEGMDDAGALATHLRGDDAPHPAATGDWR